MAGTYDTDMQCEYCNLYWAMTKGCGKRIFCPYCGKEQPTVNSLVSCLDIIEQDFQELRNEIEDLVE